MVEHAQAHHALVGATKMLYRTLVWEVSSQLTRFGISSLVSQHVLTADPTFGAVVPFGAQPETGALVALYEANGAREDAGWSSLSTMHTWAVCARDDQLTPRRKTWLREIRCEDMLGNQRENSKPRELR